MNRATALSAIRVAGYHGDRATFTRVYVENRISLAVASSTWNEGKAAKARGTPCSCADCRPTNGT